MIVSAMLDSDVTDAAQPGTTKPEHRVVFQTMGTVASLVVRGPFDTTLADQIIATFAEMDERFSLYRPQSEASRVSSRTLAFQQASDRYRQAYWVAHDWMTLTDGAFSPFRLDGTIDLHGVVKALAMDAAAEVLAGVSNWCLNVGGDVVAAGSAAADRPWSVGIVDPADRDRMISQAALSRDLPAFATSGTSERGEHIWRLPSDKQFRQVTVQATDIVTADVLATAIVSGGPGTLAQTCAEHQIEVLAFEQNGQPWATPAFRR